MQATLTKPPSAERQSAWAWRRFRRHRAVLIGFSLLSLLLSAVLAPWSPYNMRSQNLSAMLEPPSLTHPFGTDELGRDLLARLVWGGRISLSIGFLLPGLRSSSARFLADWEVCWAAV